MSALPSVHRIQAVTPSACCCRRSPASHELAKIRKKMYDQNRHFQESGAAKLPSPGQRLWSALMAKLRKSAVRIAVTLKAGLGSNFLSQRSILCGNMQEGESHYICDMGKVRRGEYYNLGSNQHVKKSAFTLPGAETVLCSKGRKALLWREGNCLCRSCSRPCSMLLIKDVRCLTMLALGIF